MTNIQIAERRWRDIKVGDVVRDPKWRWQRWQTVTKIEHDNGSIEAWWTAGEHDKRGYRAGDLELVEVQDEAPPPPITAAALADLMDECSDDGQWNGSDICDALANVIDKHGGWSRCPEHGAYSASNATCPFDHDA